MDGNEGERGAQQPVVAIAVRGGLELEFQGIGHLERRHRRRRCRPMQQVHHVRARHHLLVEGERAGLGDGIQAVERDHGEHLDELPIAVWVPGEPLAQARHGRG